MTIRSVLLGLLVGTGLVLAPVSVRAEDRGAFEVEGLRAGMTLNQIKRTIEQRELGPPTLVRAPSFEQEIALARKERIAPHEYKGVQTLRAGNGDSQVEVFFVALPNGPVAAKITAEVYGGTSSEELSKGLVSKYGPPERQSDYEWLWGDADTFYARTKPYLEFQPKPVSPTAPSPIARLILGDPALQEHSRQAITKKAQNGS